jgi:hypothetical protein
MIVFDRSLMGSVRMMADCVHGGGYVKPWKHVAFAP